jgi:hypothetical protein
LWALQTRARPGRNSTAPHQMRAGRGRTRKAAEAGAASRRASRCCSARPQPLGLELLPVCGGLNALCALFHFAVLPCFQLPARHTLRSWWLIRVKPNAPGNKHKMMHALSTRKREFGLSVDTKDKNKLGCKQVKSNQAQTCTFPAGFSLCNRVQSGSGRIVVTKRRPQGKMKPSGHKPPSWGGGAVLVATLTEKC